MGTARVRVAGVAVAALALTAAGAVAMATGDGSGVAAGADGSAAGSGHGHGGTVSAQLSGYEEDPLVLSTTGTGAFRARVDERSGEVRWTLRYAALEGDVTQAHIHFGGRHQSGGISVFLCSNLGNGPAGTQACPPAPATVRGTLRAADVIGPEAQGIAPGQFGELLAAVRAGVTYANVHSTLRPGGEVRGQLG